MIVRAIAEGRARLIEQRGDKGAIYLVRIPSAEERVYVLAAGLRLVTAWPPEARLNEKRRLLST